MAENLVKNQVCEVCGADVRLNALFCYNCGSQVASDEEVAAESENGDVSSAWFEETIAQPSPAGSGFLSKKKPEAAEKKMVETSAGSSQKSGEKYPQLRKESKEPLRTAASIRKRESSVLKKRVEISWEAHESAPNLWFLLVSLVLLAFAGFVLFAMLYLK